MKAEPKTIRAIQPNRGVEAKFRKKLQLMIAEMHGSVEHWITAAYRSRPPRMTKLVEIAEDALSPSDYIQKIISELAKKWINRFEDGAPKIAEGYLRSMFNSTDNSFQAALKEAGWTVKFTLTSAVRDVFNASLNSNIALIKSIPVEYLEKVQGIVMRSYTAGRDLETMVKELKQLYPETADRAAMIALDQSNKANAVVNRARNMELGIEEGIWMHSSAGKTPRPGHVAAGKRKQVFKYAKGCFIDGEWIQPGEKINCRCTSRSILPIQ